VATVDQLVDYVTSQVTSWWTENWLDDKKNLCRNERPNVEWFIKITFEPTNEL